MKPAYYIEDSKDIVKTQTKYLQVFFNIIQVEIPPNWNRLNNKN
jgi:hypothetical protein